ncbi:MAG: FAD-binding oxidoreductase [Myxococcales bacterium]|nr:FAD-binding oxidoreductase [Myxococcales bacterium]
MRTRRVWGWGYEGDGPDPAALSFAEASLGALLGPLPPRRKPPAPDAIVLAPPRCPPPRGLEGGLSDAPAARALHALGRSYRDLARATRGRFDNPPDYVFQPTSEDDVVRALEAADAARLAVIPFGGGTSVSGGVEPTALGDLRGTLTIDLRRLSRLVEVDATSGAARIEAGASGPEIEAALKAHGLSLRFFPQSFELSTLGGWIATRAGGHFATGPTHIDDLVESVRLVTPRGTLATRRLPASGAGPQPERLVLGSEGTLGIVTEAWVRVFRRPARRSAVTVAFADFAKGTLALRGILQAGLLPTNARLIDGPEAIMSGAGAGDTSLLLLAQESADLPTAGTLEACADIARQHGGQLVGEIRTTDAGSGGRDATGETYRSAFFRAPYLRDELVLRGVFVETYETAVTWDRLAALDDAVRRAVNELDLGPHLLACRITHAYRDGCAPYYTVICRAPDADGGLALWADLKAAITSAIVDAGGTSTHHHAVGRDVVPFYERERPPLFESALRAAKRAVDPNGILNPGVLFPRGP